MIVHAYKKKVNNHTMYTTVHCCLQQNKVFGYTKFVSWLILYSQLINTPPVLEKLKSRAPLLRMWQTQKYRTNHHLVRTQNTLMKLWTIKFVLQLESSQFNSVGKSSFMATTTGVNYPLDYYLYIKVAR